MSNVVSISKNKPHKSGEFKCLVCEHEYVGVSPIKDEKGNPLLWHECPQCGCERATHKYHIQRSDYFFRCNCGNSLFEITPDGSYCPNCGLEISS